MADIEKSLAVVPVLRKMPVPFWLSWLLLGLIAGVIAQLLYPKRLVNGLLPTVALGILGAMVGGMLCELLLGSLGQPLTETVGDYSILAAVIGANLMILVPGWVSPR
jgi:uncharacterized membrane protein YeaQ/YmgE (transglycosylase-associated protein family)